VINNNETFVGTIENSVLTQHDLANIVIVTYTKKNNIAFAGHLSWGGKRLMAIGRYPLKSTRCSAVIYRYVMPGCSQVASHRKTHDTESAKTHAGHL
jgi:hypothetical protein